MALVADAAAKELERLRSAIRDALELDDRLCRLHVAAALRVSDDWLRHFAADDEAAFLARFDVNARKVTPSKSG